MQADLRLGQLRSGQMKNDPPRSESDQLKVNISEIITALVRWMDLRYLISSLARLHLQHRVMLYRVDLRIWEALAGFSPLLTTIH